MYGLIVNPTIGHATALLKRVGLTKPPPPSMLSAIIYCCVEFIYTTYQLEYALEFTI